MRFAAHSAGLAVMLLPFSVSLFVAAGVVALTLVLELIPWWQARQAHWTEQARKLMPARVAARQYEWAIPIGAALAGRFYWPDVSMAWALIGGYLGCVVGAIPLIRAVVPGLTFRQWVDLYVQHLTIRAIEWGTLIVAIVCMPPKLSLSALAIAAAFVAFRVTLSFGVTLKILRLLGNLQPASPRVIQIVKTCSAQTGVAVRATWESRDTQANAMAAIATQELIFTTRLLEVASDDELRAITRHELAHLAESKAMLWQRIAGDLAIVPLVFLQPAIAAFGPPGLVVIMAAVFLIFVLRSRLSQTLEKRADRHAIVPEESPEVYARALETLYRINQMPVVMKGTGLLNHPDLYDRMVAAGVTPGYPRPKPPRSISWLAMPVVVGITAAAMGVFVH